MLDRAYSVLEIKVVDEEQYVIEGTATTPTVDRMGDIVEPTGAKFALPLHLLWQHHSDKPVGEVTYARPTNDGIPFHASIRKPSEFTSTTLRERTLEAWESVKSGLVRAVSIGFRVLDHEVMKDGGWRIIEWEWLELSLVTIPAQQEATITVVKSIDEALRAAYAVRRGIYKPRCPGHLTVSTNSRAREGQL